MIWDGFINRDDACQLKLKKAKILPHGEIDLGKDGCCWGQKAMHV